MLTKLEAEAQNLLVNGIAPTLRKPKNTVHVAAQIIISLKLFESVDLI